MTVLAEPTTAAPALLEVRDLVVEYPSRRGGAPVRVLHGVDLDVPPGTTLAVVGESGCGKSTLARALVRLVGVSQGSIRFEGRDVTGLRGRDLAAHRADVQMIFQDPYGSLNPRMTAAQIIAEGLPGRGNRGKRSHTAVRALMEQVGLDAGSLDRRPAEFSGGQRQRIGIARALAASPRLLVCDEPTSALDVSVQSQVLELLDGLRAGLGLTTIFISHNLGVVRQISDRIAVMYLGRIVETGPTATVFATPRHPYTKALVASVPDPVADGPLKPRRSLLQGELPSPAKPPTGCPFNTRCPLAVERCRVDPPVLVPVGPTQHAACWRSEDVVDWQPRAGRRAADGATP